MWTGGPGRALLGWLVPWERAEPLDQARGLLADWPPSGSCIPKEAVQDGVRGDTLRSAEVQVTNCLHAGAWGGSQLEQGNCPWLAEETAPGRTGKCVSKQLQRAQSGSVRMAPGWKRHQRVWGRSPASGEGQGPGQSLETAVPRHRGAWQSYHSPPVCACPPTPHRAGPSRTAVDSQGRSPWPRAGSGAGNISQESLLRGGLRAAPGLGEAVAACSSLPAWKAASGWRAGLGKAQPSGALRSPEAGVQRIQTRIAPSGPC